MKVGSTDQTEIEGTRNFKLKTYFSSSHFNQSKNRLNRLNFKETIVLKNSGKTFLQNHLEHCFYDMTCMFMTSNYSQNQFFKEKFKL